MQRETTVPLIPITYLTPDGRWPPTEEDYAAVSSYTALPAVYSVTMMAGFSRTTRRTIVETKNPVGTYTSIHFPRNAT